MTEITKEEADKHKKLFKKLARKELKKEIPWARQYFKDLIWYKIAYTGGDEILTEIEKQVKEFLGDVVEDNCLKIKDENLARLITEAKLMKSLNSRVDDMIDGYVEAERKYESEKNRLEAAFKSVLLTLDDKLNKFEERLKEIEEKIK